MFIHIKKILSFVLLMPLILGTVSACSCNNGSITDNIKKNDKGDIKEVINNRNIADLRDKEEKFDLIKNTISEKVDKNLNKWAKNFEVNDNSAPNEKKLAPLLDTVELKKELSSKTDTDVFGFFNNKIKNMLAEINNDIINANSNVYQKLDTDWAIKFLNHETKISVNQVNLNDLNQVLSNSNDKVKMKRLDLEFSYNIRYDDKMPFVTKNIDTKIVISNNINVLTNIVKILETKISDIVSEPLKTKYSDVFFYDEVDNSYLEVTNFKLSEIRNTHKNSIYNFFKDLINNAEGFKELNVNNKIKYNSSVDKFIIDYHISAYPLDYRTDNSHWEKIFPQIINNNDENFFYKEMLSKLTTVKCETEKCETNKTTKKGFKKFFNAVYALLPMEIAGLPLQGYVTDSKNNNVAITTTLWVSKKKLQDILKIFSKIVTDFFNYYKINWNQDEIIFRVTKKDVFEKLINILKDNTSKWSTSKFSLIFNNLLNDFQNNAETNKILMLFGPSTNSYVEFNHHWSYEESKQVLIYEGKKNNFEIATNDNKTNINIKFNGTHEFTYSKVFNVKKALKIIYDNK